MAATMSNFDTPVKCADCSTWWRGQTHTCAPVMVTASTPMQPVLPLQIDPISPVRIKTTKKPLKANRPWDKNDTQLLIQLITANPKTPHDALAKLFNRTYDGVRVKISKLKKSGHINV